MGDMADYINTEYGEDRPEPEQVIVHYEKRLCASDRAVRYLINGKEQWIPKSVHDDFEDGSLSVHRWFAEKEGLPHR